MAAKTTPQTSAEKDFEQRIIYTQQALGLIEKEWSGTDPDSIRLVVLTWDRIRAVGGDFSLKDADGIKKKVAAHKQGPAGEFGQQLDDYADQS